MRKLNNTLFCFSPPVMVATFLIEIGLLAYTVWRYKLNKVTRLIVLMLLFLAGFQLAEYMLCGGLGFTGFEWARFGYVSITLLPPLGLHLALTLAGKKQLAWLAALGYLTAAIFIVFFVFVSGSMFGTECRPNYAVFHVHEWLVPFFVLYYYGWLLVTVWLSLRWAKQKPKARRALRSLALSYGVFIVPATLANVLDPTTIAGIPSIMCGFAILTAILLVWRVAPASGAPKRHK